MFGDKLVHDERQRLLVGQRLLGFAAVGVRDVDTTSSTWTEVSHDCYRRQHYDNGGERY